MIYLTDDLWETIDLISRHFKCKCCGHEAKKPSVRRRMEHLLQMGTGIRSCTYGKKRPTDDDLLLIENELSELDEAHSRLKTKRDANTAAVEAMPVPKRTRKQATISFDRQEKDSLDLQYARMLICNATTVSEIILQFL